MLNGRSAHRPVAAALVFLAVASFAAAQAPDCGILISAATQMLPNFSGTLPPSAAMTTAGNDNYLYVATQWGFARGSLTNPATPGPFTQFVVGNEGGSGNGGIIPILCDCHQGTNTMDVAESSDGTMSRIISDWQPHRQNSNSGLAAQLVQGGTNGMTFGQQINLPDNVSLGARIAAVHFSTKTFGYFPTQTDGDDVQMVDLTSPTGSPNPNNALQSTLAINWSSINTGTTPPSISGVKLRQATVVTSSYNKTILVGSEKHTGTPMIHVAEIDPTSGALSEPVPPVQASGTPAQLDVAVVNNEIFIFSAENGAGLQVYQYTPGTGISPVGGIAGTYGGVAVRGPQPFPAIFGYRVSGTNSFVDIYDTRWLTQGGTPLLAQSLQHNGATDAFYLGAGFEALVQQTGSTLTAYLYREILSTPQNSIKTAKLDISCIAANPNAPPIPFATMTNNSSVARGDGVNYYGDNWTIKDASISFAPITELDWDFHDTGTFTPELIQTGTNLGGSGFQQAYWPCDELNGGSITTGGGCYQSLGTPAATYLFGLNAKNANGPGAAPYVSGPIPVVAPQLSMVGWNGTTLQVLAGNPNNGDARGSQGNTAEASFNWTFTPSGSATGTVVTVPLAATGFSLSATYKDGYSTSLSGSISQVDLVPNFSLAPNPVVKSGTLTLKNLMQIASAAHLNSVDYAIAPGGPTGTLPAAFNTVNATAQVTAPSTAGNYTVTLTWNYLDHGGVARQSTAQLPFQAIDFQPQPTLKISTDAAGSQVVGAFGNPPVFSLRTGTTYYLWDGEQPTLPPGFGATFWKSSDSNPSISSGDTQIGASSSAGPVTYVPASCSSSCYIKVQVAGVVTAWGYSAQTGGGGPPPGCPPNCPGGGNQQVQLMPPTPTTPTVGENIVFTAAVSGFSSTPSYQWDFGDSGGTGGSGGGGTGGCNPQVPASCQAVAAFTAGPNPNTHVYAATGTYTVTVQATGDGVTKSSSTIVTVAAAGPPSGAYTISGASLGAGGRFQAMLNQPVTFTSSEAHAASWAWDFGDGSTASGQVVTHTFSTVSSPNVTLTITGDGTNTIGTTAAAIPFSVLDPGVLYLGDSGRYQVRATWSSSGQHTSGTGTAINLTSDTGYFWFFSASNLEVVIKVLDACSVDGHVWVFGGGLTNLQVTLTVTDTQTNTTKTYTSPEGTAFQPLQDTNFEACSTSSSGSAHISASATTADPSVSLATPSPANPLVGDSVSFTATPSNFTGTVQYKWDFGDGGACPPFIPGCNGGGSSGTTGPATNTHIYSTAGTYTVTVTATSGAQTATATQSVVVSPAGGLPHPSIGYTVSGATLGAGGVWQAPVGQPVTLSAQETHGTYLWDFGGGVTSTDASATHTFTTAGSATVTLTVTGDGTNTQGTSSIVVHFTINDPYTLYLDGGRFAVTASWSTSSPGTGPSSGQGTQVDLSTDTGYFWFFDPTNAEVIVKVLDACSVDGHFWVFASGLTNLGVNLTITDTQSGTTMSYANTEGNPYVPVQDFKTFNSCGTGN